MTRPMPIFGGSALPRLWPLDHCSDRLRVERLCAVIAVTWILQPGADFAVAMAPCFALPLRSRRASATSSGHGSACDFRPPTFLPVSLRLRSWHREAWRQGAPSRTHEGTGDLAHHLAAEVITVGQIIARGCQESNATLGQRRH